MRKNLHDRQKSPSRLHKTADIAAASDQNIHLPYIYSAKINQKDWFIRIQTKVQSFRNMKCTTWCILYNIYVQFCILFIRLKANAAHTLRI